MIFYWPFVFRYIGGFRKGVVVGPGTIYETNGNIRCDAMDTPQLERKKPRIL